jgi:type IX secretion system PorP/SprF family membrane protein
MPENLTKRYFDLSAGLLYYSRTVFAGVAVKHFNTPVNYYIQNKSDSVNKGLPVRFTAQLGGEVRMSPDDVYHHRFYSPALLYAYQSGLHQLTFNNYFDLGGFFGGMGYRFNFSNSDAIIFSVGAGKEMFKIGYSFDYTVSKLGINTGGTHELGITINFEKSRFANKNYRFSDCFNQFR